MDLRTDYSDEEIVENCLLHWINIENTKWIQYVIKNAHKLSMQVSIDYKVVLGLLFEIERVMAKRVINEIINKDILIKFDSEEDKK